MGGFPYAFIPWFSLVYLVESAAGLPLYVEDLREHSWTSIVQSVRTDVRRACGIVLVYFAKFLFPSQFHLISGTESQLSEEKQNTSILSLLPECEPNDERRTPFSKDLVMSEGTFVGRLKISVFESLCDIQDWVDSSPQASSDPSGLERLGHPPVLLSDDDPRGHTQVPFDSTLNTDYIPITISYPPNHNQPETRPPTQYFIPSSSPSRNAHNQVSLLFISLFAFIIFVASIFALKRLAAYLRLKLSSRDRPRSFTLGRGAEPKPKTAIEPEGDYSMGSIRVKRPAIGKKGSVRKPLPDAGMIIGSVEDDGTPLVPVDHVQPSSPGHLISPRDFRLIDHNNENPEISILDDSSNLDDSRNASPHTPSAPLNTRDLIRPSANSLIAASTFRLRLAFALLSGPLLMRTWMVQVIVLMYGWSAILSRER